MYHTSVLHGRGFKSHIIQAILGLMKVVFLCHFCWNVRYYTVNGNEPLRKTRVWIFSNSTYVLNNILNVFMGVVIIYILDHKAVCTSKIHFGSIADMQPLGEQWGLVWFIQFYKLFVWINHDLTVRRGAGIKTEAFAKVKILYTSNSPIIARIAYVRKRS